MKRTSLLSDVSLVDNVVLFDGVCRLCSAWARFLIRFDRQCQFKLATVQSPQGQALLQHHGLPTSYYDSMVLIENGQLYTQSTAFLRVMKRLRWPWPLLYLAWLIPAPLRNWLYDRIALNRYRLFGRYQQCVVPDKEALSHFLQEES